MFERTTRLCQGARPLNASTRRIVILGKTGAGKSSLANTIFGEEMFKVNHSSKSGTSECKAKTKTVNGRRLTLIDTPGFFDTNKSEDERKREIVRSIVECAPGPHAFLILLKKEKYCEHEQSVIDRMKEYFSEEVYRYATVVFTHGDDLQEGQTIEDFINEDEKLIDLRRKCGGRCHVIDNKYWKNKPEEEYRSNQFQVKEILKTIDNTVTKNDGGYYTNELLQVVEENIQHEIETIRPLSGNMSDEEIRERAKKNIFEKLLNHLVGTGAGMLLGALFGVLIMATAVLKSLKTFKKGAKSLIGVAVLAGAGAKAGAGKTEEPAAGETEKPAEGDTGDIRKSIKKGASSAAGYAVKALAASAAVGAVVGGVTGCLAASDAETPQDAAKAAARDVYEGAKYIQDKIDEFLKKD